MVPKIIELIIEDEDDKAGLDGIALVEHPAHEATFEYFNEDNEPKKYVLADEEVPEVLGMFAAYGEPQGFLESEGWYISEVKELGRQDFATILANPNAPSAQDTPTVRFRYKYVGGISSNSRDFCREMISANKVFRIEDIDKMSVRSVNPVGPSGYSIFDYRGSYNCKHRWVQLIYRSRGKINNDANSTSNLSGEDGMPGPDTRTTATIAAGNTPPRTGFSASNPDVSALSPYVEQITDRIEKKPVLTGAEGNMNILGYNTRFFHLCPLAIELFQHLIEMSVDEETQGMIRSAAQIADNVFRIESEVLENGGSVEQLTEAVLLVEDFVDLMEEIDEETGMKHDVSFMEGHLEIIANAVKENMAELDDACWPGYEAIGTKTLNGREVPNCVPEKMAMEKMKQEFQSYNDYPESAKNNACKAIRWKEEHGEEVKGMTQTGWVRANQLCKGENISEETIARMSAFQRHRKNAEVSPQFKDEPWKDAGYVAWLGWGGTTGIDWAESKLKSIRGEMSFSVFNAEQRLVVGAAMIPDKMIIRRNEITGEIYYVYFTKETIMKLQQKFMKDKLLDATNIEHGRKYLRDVDVVESWIVEDEQKDKQQVFNMNYPVGTWMVIMKVNDDNVWNKVKNGELKGFSVQGYFLEKAKFKKEEHLLEQIKNILSEVR